jgi:uncharacterized protein (TIGR02996 family)
MSTEAALLNAIRAMPDEDTPRLVYADYLDELGGAGNIARAEFIRLQIQLAGMDERNPARDALEDRENELLRQHEREWLGALSDPLAVRLTEWRFERGFVGKLRTDTRTLNEHGAELFERHPINRVRIDEVDEETPGPFSELAERSWWSRVRDLGIREFSSPSVLPCEPLLRSRHLSNLRRLQIHPTEDPETPLQLPTVLARCPCLSGLEEFHISGWAYDPGALVPTFDAMPTLRQLRLTGCFFTTEGMAALLASELGTRGCRLELAEGNLSDELWPALSNKKAKPVLGRIRFTNMNRALDIDLPTLLSSPVAANLDVFDLGETHLAGSKVRAIATSGFMTRATEIGLTRCDVNSNVMAVLANASAPKLRKLTLGETGLRSEGVFALCDASWANALTHLNLMRNYLDDTALIALAKSGKFVNVRHLDLRMNSPDLADDCKVAISDTGVIALANSSNFARLRHLNLYRTRVTVRGVDAILNSPHWNITELELGGYDLGNDFVRVLATSPQLVRLTKLGLSFTPSLGGDALLPLAESPYLSPLCHLDIRYNNTSEHVRNILAERLGRRLEDYPSIVSW